MRWTIYSYFWFFLNSQSLFIFIIIIVLLLLHYLYNYYYYYYFISGSSNSSSSSSTSSIIIIIIIGSSIDNISELIVVSTSIFEHFISVLLLVHQCTPPLFLRNHNGNKVMQLFLCYPCHRTFFLPQFQF